MKKSLLISTILFLFIASSAGAIVSDGNQNDIVTSAYRKYKDVNNLTIKVPTVVEVPFSDQYLERLNFAVLDATSNNFEPYFLKQDVLKYESIIGVSSLPTISNIGPIMDGNLSTYADFALPENVQGIVSIILTSTDMVTSSALTTLLDNFVALPSHIEIIAMVNGQEKVVLAKKEMDQNTVNFPKTTSNKWTISYWYSQPLRISELKLVQENNLKNTLNSVRFLAQPGHSYRIYFDPDRYVSAPVGESANLSIAKDVMNLPNTSSQNNPDYVIADTDKDGVPDISDNCVSSPNPDQADINNNQRGDSCDDFDQDTIVNEQDNCPNNPNFDQRDTDGDGIGDVCDNQESRVTEKYPWIPWVGIGFAAAVLIGLFAITASSSSKEVENVNH